MARAMLGFVVLGAVLGFDCATSFADRWGSSPFGIERGVKQGGRVRFRTGGCGYGRGSSPFGVERGVYQGGRVRFRSNGWGDRGGCGCDSGYTRRYAGYGSSWSVLRRHLATDNIGSAFRYIQTRRYFFKRYPYLFVQGTPLDGEELNPDHYLHPDYDVAAHPLTKNQRLHLGVWKTYIGEYAAARESFASVIAEHAGQREASWGLALCSILGRNWKQAAKDLARVAEIGEMDLGEKLLVDEAFGERDAIERVMTDLRTATRYVYGDGDAHVVAAWLHATQGNDRLARVHLKKARRWSADNAALAPLSKHLDPQAAPADEPGAAPESPATPDTGTAADKRATDPVLIASR